MHIANSCLDFSEYEYQLLQHTGSLLNDLPARRSLICYLRSLLLGRIRMNLIFVVVIVACLPDGSDGFTAQQYRIAAARSNFYTSSALSSSQTIGSEGRGRSIVSTILSVGNVDCIVQKRSIQSILLNNLKKALRPMYSSRAQRKLHENENQNESKRVQSCSVSAKSTPDTINKAITIIKSKITLEKFRLLPAFFIVNVLSFLKLARPCVASGAMSGPVQKSNFTPFQGACIWGCLFILSATLHSAESAITKISPWKVQ